jgi:hypothetical protein
MDFQLEVLEQGLALEQAEVLELE